MKTKKEPCAICAGEVEEDFDEPCRLCQRTVHGSYDNNCAYGAHELRAGVSDPNDPSLPNPVGRWQDPDVEALYCRDCIEPDW